MNQIISDFGTIISIVSGIFAFWQAHKAHLSASKAEKIYNFLNKNHNITKLSILISENNRILSIIGKYGPAATIDSIAGSDLKNDAYIIQQYIITLKDNLMLFKDDQKYIITICEYLENTLPLFVKSYDNSLQYGKIFFRKLSTLSIIINRNKEANKDCLQKIFLDE